MPSSVMSVGRFEAFFGQLTQMKPDGASSGRSARSFAAMSARAVTKMCAASIGASGRAMSLNETEGWVKVTADARTDQVLGVHMIGPEVTELVAEAALAIEMGATVGDLAHTIHAHPTLPEAIMEAAEAVHNMAVHIFQAPKKG